MPDRIEFPSARPAVGETPSRRGTHVLGAFIDALGWDEVLQIIRRWAAAGQSRYVCCCNAHSLVTTQRDATVREVIGRADLAVPDGTPVAWMMRRSGFARQARISGPDLMWKYCAVAEAEGSAIFLYGNTAATLEALRRRLQSAFPRLVVAGMIAPPFRQLQPEEDLDVVIRINRSGAAVVFVSLGCPKQELWMAAHRQRISAVMIGVGAAFDFHAGSVKRAPVWMQHCGLEWLHRLCTEPRRLWRRYLATNSQFILGACRQLMAQHWRVPR